MNSEEVKSKKRRTSSEIRRFLGTDPNFNTNAPPFGVRGCKVNLGGAFLGQGVQRVIPNSCANSSKYVR